MAIEDNLKESAGRLLVAAGMTVAVAESCTGGLLGAALTDVSGSSAYFLGGILAYDNSLKTALLGVSPVLLEEFGAVSAECALQMVRGAIDATGADIALSVTGIAGPLGGTAQKPVGTTYIGLAAPGMERVEHFCWDGDRAENRQLSVTAALNMLVEHLSRQEIAALAGASEGRAS